MQKPNGDTDKKPGDPTLKRQLTEFLSLINVACFKPQIFGAIHCAAINNQY